MYIYICSPTSIHIRIHMYVCRYVINVCMYVCMYACMYVCMQLYACMYVCRCMRVLQFQSVDRIVALPLVLSGILAWRVRTGGPYSCGNLSLNLFVCVLDHVFEKGDRFVIAQKPFTFG